MLISVGDPFRWLDLRTPANFPRVLPDHLMERPAVAFPRSDNSLTGVFRELLGRCGLEDGTIARRHLLRLRFDVVDIDVHAPRSLVAESPMSLTLDRLMEQWNVEDAVTDADLAALGNAFA